MKKHIVGLIALTMLQACEFQRAHEASAAKKEQVLACMGVPAKKAKVDETEVWLYNSTNGSGSTTSLTQRYGSALSAASSSGGYGSHSKSFCTVNVVMKNDTVAAVNYNGPTGGLLTQDEQCGYAVEHCVE